MNELYAGMDPHTRNTYIEIMEKAFLPDLFVMSPKGLANNHKFCDTSN